MKLLSIHRQRWKMFRKNEKGGVLISALFAFFFITAVVMGIASITRNQIYQLRLTQDVYEAKAVMVLSEKHFPIDEENLNTTLTYDTGVVHIEQENSENYTMTGHFDNNLTLTKDLYFPDEGSEDTDQDSGNEKKKDVDDQEIKKDENELNTLRETENSLGNGEDTEIPDSSSDLLPIPKKVRPD